MASIVYVTNKKMIEYHRINGNQNINFWRPLSQTHIRKLYPNDIVFFLTGIQKNGKNKEKGIVGYGHFVKSRKLTLDQMWDDYKDKNGYYSKQELYNALKEYGEEIPAKIDCLEISKVVFFSHPIYPSEIGLHFPINLESYAYLDDQKKDNTFKLLMKAKEAGINVWSTVINKEINEEEIFEKDLLYHRVSSLAELVGDLSYTKTEGTKNNKIIKKIMKFNDDIQLINHSKSQYFEMGNDKCIVYIPAVMSKRSVDNIKKLTGHIYMWLAVTKEENYNIEFKVYVTDTMKKQLAGIMKFPEKVSIISICDSLD